MPKQKRVTLGEITNQAVKDQIHNGKPVKPSATTRISAPYQKKAKKTVKSAKSKTTTAAKCAVGQAVSLVPELVKIPRPPSRKPPLCSSVELDQSESPSAVSGETPITAVKNHLQATTIHDESMHSPSSPSESMCSTTEAWKDIDQAEAQDPLFSSEYAPDIYTYMKEREVHFLVPAYMTSQADISASMRTILVDWLIEVQENFELFHETLYLAVKVTDRYLSLKDVKREYLQLVGATSMLIAAKFEELSPPLVDDFLYLCDDAYTHEDLLKMERDILHTLDYDINIPVAYRFLRRLARAAEATMETHTLARYISESTLQDYSFVTEKPSRIAACSMYLALRMKALGPWTSTLIHYSGYTVFDMLPLVGRMNTLLQTPLGQTATVRSKYSHEVFFKVATLTPLADVDEDATLALSQHAALILN